MNTILRAISTSLMALTLGAVVGVGASVGISAYSKYKRQAAVIERTLQATEAETVAPPATTAPVAAPTNLLLYNAEKPQATQPSKRQPAEVLQIVTIDERNSVVLSQSFTDASVAQTMRELQAISNALPKEVPIYLVLNTPGGSVDAGLKLIAFAKALPQKVKTITIFAASMGFQTVQQLDERLIIANGTLMSHPVAFGVGGDTPYQIRSRMKWIMDMADSLDRDAAARMGISFTAYQNLVHDEFWTFDQDAVTTRAADKRVAVLCGKYSKASKWIDVDTIFGTFSVELASCPLIPGIISVKEPQDSTPGALEYVKLMFVERKRFTREFILTNKFSEYQGAR